MSAIEVDDLVITYGELVAVNQLSFSVEPGEVVGVLGRNGAGKTSTIETLEGLRTPQSGCVRVLGRDPATERRALASVVGVMLQDGGPYPILSPRRALRLDAAYYEHPRDTEELIELLGLGSVANTPAKRLSGGEKRRLALALALVGNPTVVFLDEPTAGVDPHGRVIIRELIADLHEKGTTTIVTTHELHEIERIADRFLILDHGMLLASGTLDELVGDEEAIHVNGGSGVDPRELARLTGAGVDEVKPGYFRLRIKASPVVMSTIAAYFSDNDIELFELRSGRESLEDLFLRLTGDGPSHHDASRARTGDR